MLGLATGSTPVGAYKCLADWCKQGLISFKDVLSVNLDEYKGLSTLGWAATRPCCGRFYCFAK